MVTVRDTVLKLSASMSDQSLSRSKKKANTMKYAPHCDVAASSFGVDHGTGVLKLELCRLVCWVPYREVLPL